MSNDGIVEFDVKAPGSLDRKFYIGEALPFSSPPRVAVEERKERL